MKIRQPVSHARAFAVIGLALDLGAWIITATAAMSNDRAFGDTSAEVSWLILVILDLLACGGAVLLTKRAIRDSHGDALVDIAQFVARVSLIGVLGIALFMFAL